MKKLIIITSIIYMSLFTACSDFLDLAPISEASVPNFYKNQTDIETAVNGAYAALQSNDLYRANYVTMMEVRSDNVEDNNPGGSAGINFNIDQFAAKSDNTVIRDTWKAQFDQIYRINNVLASLEVVENPNVKLQFEGEARFLRALAYFNIVRLWGSAPLVLEPIRPEQAYDLVRNSEGEIYTAIQNDLAIAQQLPKKYADAKNLGRVTSGAAKTLLAKTYLTQKKYNEASAILKDIIENYSDIYSLQETAAEVFNFDNEMNSEIIFAIRYSKTIQDESANSHDAYDKFNLDPTLLDSYETSDERRDLLNLVEVNANFVVKKYADTPDPTTGGIGFDFLVFRYSDVLLMYAEVLNEIGYDSNVNSEAFKSLNAVRARANASLYDSSILNDQNSFRDAVLEERRLELPLENHRWFDLIRSDKAVEAMAAVGFSITPTDFLYPIPITEIDIIDNPTDFPQNPGY